MCLAYQFNVDYRVTMLLMLWALGWSMIVLAVLVYLPTVMVTAFGVVLVAGHNLFDTVRIAHPLWVLLCAGFCCAHPGARGVRRIPARSLDWRDGGWLGTRGVI
jgi:uncharacterized membrane protein